VSKVIKIPSDFFYIEHNTFKYSLRRDIIDWLYDHKMYYWDIASVSGSEDYVIILDDAFDDTLFILTWL
jgi:hypothetical protein